MNKPLAFLLLCFAAAEGSALAARTILVLPFENKTGRADIAWLSESFADTLSKRLEGDGRLTLKRTERDLAIRGAGLPPGIPLSHASALRIARSLSADWIVGGKFSVEGGVLKTGAYLIDANRLKMSGPFEANGQLAELAEIETGLAWRILSMQDPSFTAGSVEDFGRQFPEIHLDAHENYVRGILATDPDARVRFLTEANRRDPSDHRAAIELGRFYYEKKDYEASAKWLSKLAGPEAEQFEVRFILGVDEFFLGRESAALKTLANLAHDAPIAEVWNNLGFLQSHLGHWVDATASFDRAYQADSNDPDYSFNLGVCMWNLKRYDVAVHYLRESLQVAPDDPEIHRLLREALAATGDTEGKTKEEKWLEAKGESLNNGNSAAILPNPRLKKTYNLRAYRAWLQAGHVAHEGKTPPEPSSVEAKP
jgi:tetratricopeptide (TPR) repeat protein